MSKRIKPDEQFARLLELSSPVAAADASLMSMAAIATALRSAGRAPGLPAPDPEFKAALRQRLVAVATVQAADPAVAGERRGVTRVGALSWRAQRRIAALAGTVTVATSFAGMGIAAARSLPGDPFYGVKRATEDVQLWLTSGDEAQGKRHLEFARERLAEAEHLSPTSSHLASTLTAMDDETRQASSELIAAYRSSHSTAPLADLVRFSSQQLSDLTQLAPTLPTSVRTREMGSVAVLTGVVKQVHKAAGGACILCGSSGGGPIPGHSVSPTKSAHPNKSPSPTSSRHPGSKESSSRPGGQPKKSSAPRKSSSPRPKSSKSLPVQLPTGVVSSILHPHKSKRPIPIITKLLGGLTGHH
jgi:hypothetical protein